MNATLNTEGTLTIPHLKKKDEGWQLVVNGKPFIILAGEIHNSSASSLEYMRDHVWNAVSALNCNSLIVPIYWELFEPEEGIFDYSLLDGLIAQARQRNIKLVLLWFASWKNSYSTYVPEWVKTDVKRFFRMETPEGKKTPRISCFCDEAQKADSKAFVALMKRIKVLDANKQTVIMVQVQNEVGVLGADRDYSPQAEKHFHEKVPEKLINELIKRKDTLQKKVKQAWDIGGMREAGTWTQVFGELAEETFSSWYMAKYIEEIASAGKAEYALPLFVNAWLVQGEGHKAGDYPSGGPVAKMIDIWQIAAPTICLTAPDIYLDDFAGVCAEYATPNNPLLIPEARRDETAAANVFYAIGKHHVLGFAPFGIESMLTNAKVDIVGNNVADASFNIQNFDNGEMLSKSYSLLQSMSPLISDCYGTEKMTGFLQNPGIMKEYLRIGGYDLKIEYTSHHKKGSTPGAGLIIKMSDVEFIVAGHGFTLIPVSAVENKNNIIEISFLEEGSFQNGEWQVYRRLNGDECRCILPAQPSIRRLKLFHYE